MSHILTLINQGRSNPANTTHRKYLINVINIWHGHLLLWAGGAVEDNVVVVDFDGVALGVGLFGSAGLSGFEPEELLHILKTCRDKFLLEYSWSQRERAHVPNVILCYVLVHVLVDPCRIHIIRKNWEFSWKDHVLLLWCGGSGWGGGDVPGETMIYGVDESWRADVVYLSRALDDKLSDHYERLIF